MGTRNLLLDLDGTISDPREGFVASISFALRGLGAPSPTTRRSAGGSARRSNGTRSDKGDLISHLLDQERISAQSAVMVGDRLHDVVGAKRHGVMSCGVLWGYGTEQELRDAGADLLISSPVDLGVLVTHERLRHR